LPCICGAHNVFQQPYTRIFHDIFFGEGAADGSLSLLILLKSFHASTARGREFSTGSGNHKVAILNGWRS
jgi:hypothetical protein